MSSRDRPIEEVIADRDPNYRDEWPVILAESGAFLGEVSIETWIDEDAALSRAIDEALASDTSLSADALARSRRGAVRVWADDFIVAAWTIDTARDWLWAHAGQAMSFDERGLAMDWRDEAAFHLVERVGHPVTPLDGAPNLLLHSADEAPPPLLVQPRQVGGRAALVVCRPGDLTVDEAATHAANEIQLRVRCAWSSITPTADERWDALMKVLNLFSQHEATRIEFMRRRRAEKEAERRGYATDGGPRPSIPMYMLAAGGGRTKPHGMPQRAAARALRLLMFSEVEIRAFIGEARRNLGTQLGKDIAVREHADGALDAAQLRRELGDDVRAQADRLARWASRSKP